MPARRRPTSDAAAAHSTTIRRAPRPPTGRSYTINDGDGTANSGIAQGSATATIHVVSVNDTPTLTGVGPSATVTEQIAGLLDTNIVAGDLDLDAAGNYAGATLTIVNHAGAPAQDIFAVVAGSGYTVAGNALQVGGQTFATFDSTGGVLTLTFTGGATPTKTLVNDAINHVTYKYNGDNPPASVVLDYTLSDGNTGAQGPGGPRPRPAADGHDHGGERRAGARRRPRGSGGGRRHHCDYHRRPDRERPGQHQCATRLYGCVGVTVRQCC